MKITPENYDEIKTDLKRFLILEIERHGIIAGSLRKLSADLGHSEDFVFARLKRGSFSSLERLWKECMKHYE